MKSFFRNRLALLLFTSLLSIQLFAQHPSAIMDLESSTQGMLVPRMSTVDRQALPGINAPADGLLVYDTDTNTFWYYNDNEWKELGAGLTDLSPGFNLTDSMSMPNDSINHGLPDVMDTITIVGEGVIDEFSKIKVCIDVEHTYLEDVHIRLIAPDGVTAIDLATGVGFGGDDFTNTCFVDGASTAIDNLSIQPPYTGIFRPEQSFSNFIGQPITGNWVLHIDDVYDSDHGKLISWNIEFGTGKVLIANSIHDTDNDTRIHVEKSLDDDQIRFDIENVESLRFFKNKNNRLLIEPLNNNGNIFIGEKTANNVALGAADNVVIGSSTGSSLFDGRDNILVGRNAGDSITSEHYNIMIGLSSGQYNTGFHNVMVGAYAGRFNKGDGNVFLGRNTGINSLGDDNVFIGKQAGGDEFGSDRLYIDNNIAALPFIYGEFDNRLLSLDGNLRLGSWDAGSTGIDSVQLLISGEFNEGVNDGGSGNSATYKLRIDAYNNDGKNIYPIYVMDENEQVDFYLKNRPSQGELPTMFFDGNAAIGGDEFADAGSGYRLSVNGKIACTEILTDAINSWPDYVFEQNYNLRSISELRRFIEDNGHLPGVPSAIEVEYNGIELGEMSRLQMEKIEELTLYLLEQDAIIESQNRRIEIQEQKFNELEKKLDKYLKNQLKTN